MYQISQVPVCARHCAICFMYSLLVKYKTFHTYSICCIYMLYTLSFNTMFDTHIHTKCTTRTQAHIMKEGDNDIRSKSMAWRESRQEEERQRRRRREEARDTAPLVEMFVDLIQANAALSLALVL